MATDIDKDGVCVMELPSKKLLHISLPSEEGGDMITMERFVSLMEQQLSNTVSWASLMVGDRCIDIDLDGSRSVHFFLLDDFPWYVHVYPKAEHSAKSKGPEAEPHSIKSIFVKCVNMRPYKLYREQGFITVLDAMKALELKTGIPVYENILVYAGKQLKVSRYLRDYHVQNNSTFFSVLRLRGGGYLPGVPFADVTDQAGPEKFDWSNSAPDWRRANQGLCIEGKCRNRRCEAYGHMVIMNKGFTEFDLINDGHTCQCPMCEKPVIPVTCGFNNCEWKVIGRKVEKLGQPPKMFRTKWKSAGDAYERFSPDKNGKVHFLDLKILCKREQRMLCCVICTGIIEGDEKVAECGHTFHSDRCFDVATVDRNCIECVARQSMTNYQKLFG